MDVTVYRRKASGWTVRHYADRGPRELVIVDDSPSDHGRLTFERVCKAAVGLGAAYLAGRALLSLLR